MYRFSISWPRLLPTNDPQHPNEEGRKYYHDVLDEIIANGMTPLVRY
jgi:beta-glucosidase/6-phospho-beta-glucosidase/beta-galactosidase